MTTGILPHTVPCRDHQGLYGQSKWPGLLALGAALTAPSRQLGSPCWLPPASFCCCCCCWGVLVRSSRPGEKWNFLRRWLLLCLLPSFGVGWEKQAWPLAEAAGAQALSVFPESGKLGHWTGAGGAAMSPLPILCLGATAASLSALPPLSFLHCKTPRELPPSPLQPGVAWTVPKTQGT